MSQPSSAPRTWRYNKRDINLNMRTDLATKRKKPDYSIFFVNKDKNVSQSGDNIRDFSNSKLPKGIFPNIK